jgi:DNA-directed RNA polymerase beta' subunit
MPKRFLSVEEIEDIISFIKPQKGIPKLTALSICDKLKNKLRVTLRNQYINPKCIQELRTILERQYFKSVIDPGTSVGIIMAMAIGEKQTQNTLNTFHFTGLSEKTTTSSVVRIIELLNATHNPKQKNCMITFLKHNKTLEEFRDMIGNTIADVRFGQLVDDYDIIECGKKYDWYDIYDQVYGETDNSSRKPTSLGLCYKLKHNMLFEYQITLEHIAKTIETEYTDLMCIHSPDSVGEIHVYPMCPDDIKVTVTYLNQENSVYYYMRDVVHRNLEYVQVCGITGITNMYIEKDRKTDTWKLETEGTNLQEILCHPNVDKIYTYSNSIWEIYHTFGIEATRQFMIDEFMRIIGDINICHIQLLVDKMTFTGTITSISRYSVRKDDIGPMTAASFEESLDKFTSAGAFTQIENTNGASSSIMCGKLGKFGTGFFDILYNI